jgi:hypothetical protein
MTDNENESGPRGQEGDLMPKELWGTFSVADHLSERAFVAEVLIYDRVVVPTPCDDEARHRWQEQGRDPLRQDRLLRILGDGQQPEDLAVRIPWTPLHRDRYLALASAAADQRAATRQQLAADVEFDADIVRMARESQQDPWHMTRLTLVDAADHQRDAEYARHLPGVWVEAVPAYTSYADAVAETGIHVATPGEATAPAAIFGWPLIVPDTDESGERLLDKAVDLARDAEFRAARSDFHEWRRVAVRDGVDPDTANTDLRLKLERYAEAMRRAKWRSRTLNAFAIAGIATGLASAFIFPPVGVAGAFIGLGSFGADKLLPDRGPAQRDRPAAFLYDIQRRFGWRAD